MFAVDPRRTLVGQVGRRLARPRRRHRHRAGQRRRARDHRRRACTTRDFIAHATTRASTPTPGRSSPTPSSDAERVTGVPADAIRELAHAYATRRDGADLLDARHHRAPQRGRQRARPRQPRAADRPRRPLGLGPRPAARPEQRAGRRRHGRAAQQAPRLPGRRRPERSGPGSRRRGARRSRPSRGLHLTLMFEAMERGELRALYVIGENPADSPRPTSAHARALLSRTRHPRRAGHLPDPHRRAGRRRPARPRSPGPSPRAPSPPANAGSSGCGPRSPPPGEARDDLAIIAGARPPPWASTGASPVPRSCGTSCARLSPMHAGMSYDRLESRGRAPVAVPRRGPPRQPVPPRLALGGRPRRPRTRPRSRVVETDGPPATSSPTSSRSGSPPAGRSTRTTPACSPAAYDSPIRYGDALDVNPDDADRPRASPTASGCGSPRAAARSRCPSASSPTCPAGLAFTTFHFPDLVDTNVLTNDAWDPRSGTAEFKAAGDPHRASSARRRRDRSALRPPIDPTDARARRRRPHRSARRRPP